MGKFLIFHKNIFNFICRKSEVHSMKANNSCKIQKPNKFLKFCSFAGMNRSNIKSAQTKLRDFIMVLIKRVKSVCYFEKTINNNFLKTWNIFFTNEKNN